MKKLLLACLVILLAGCYTQKNALKDIGKARSVYPEIFAGQCADAFKPVVYDSTRTEYLPGKTIWRYDTVTVDCDSIERAAETDPTIIIKTVRVPCPPCADRVDTFLQVREVASENTARIKEQELKLKAADERVASLKPYRWLFFAACGVIVLGIIGLLYTIRKRKRDSAKLRALNN